VTKGSSSHVQQHRSLHKFRGIFTRPSTGPRGFAMASSFWVCQFSCAWSPAAVESPMGVPWYVVWLMSVAIDGGDPPAAFFPPALLSNPLRSLAFWQPPSHKYLRVDSNSGCDSATSCPISGVIWRSAGTEFTLYARLHPVVESVTNPAGIKTLSELSTHKSEPTKRLVAKFWPRLETNFLL